MVMVFAVAYSVAPSTWSGIIFVQTVAVGASAFAFGVLAWQLVWRRVATGASLVARGSVALGIVMLAYNYAAIVLRQAAVLRSPIGIEQMAELTAALTVDLWISSVFLVLGAASHVVFSPRGSKQN